MITHRVLMWAKWFARDYVFWGAFATTLIVVFAALALAERLMFSGPFADPLKPLAGVAPAAIRRYGVQLATLLSLIGPAIATAGIVSQDTWEGRYRLLFVRPVSRSTYYAVSFATRGAAFVLVSLLLAIAFSIVVAPVALIRFTAVMVLSYLFVGGIGFVISSTYRYDWLAFVLVYLVSALGWDVLELTGPVGWVEHARWVLRLLPPLPLQSTLVSYAFSTRSPPLSTVLWLGAYGAASICAALLLARRRQFTPTA